MAAATAALAPSFGWLIAARAVQGLGAATLMVIPRAVIHDVAAGPEATRIMAAIMIVLSVSPMLAPLAGSLVLAWGVWRDIFLVLAVASLLSLALIACVLPETLPSTTRQPVRLTHIWKGTKYRLSDPRLMGLTMIGPFGLPACSCLFRRPVLAPFLPVSNAPPFLPLMSTMPTPES